MYNPAVTCKLKSFFVDYVPSKINEYICLT